MGLLNKRTINKAKALAEKNKDKIASGVSKATDAIDKKTGGKHADKLKKLDDAAAKYAGNEPSDVPDGAEAEVAEDAPADVPIDDDATDHPTEASG